MMFESDGAGSREQGATRTPHDALVVVPGWLTVHPKALVRILLCMTGIDRGVLLEFPPCTLFRHCMGGDGHARAKLAHSESVRLLSDVSLSLRSTSGIHPARHQFV